MTVPDPRSGGPDEKTVVVPTGQVRQPPPYGQPPGRPDYPPTAQYPPAPGYGEQPYNPYGHQFPAADQFPAVDRYPGGYPVPAPARRSAGVAVALVLHVLSALPFLAGAALLILGGASVQSMVPADQLAEFQSVTGVDPFAVLYGFAVFVGAVALLFLIFAVLAFARRNWARILVTIMTVFFVLLTGVGVLAGLAGGAAVDPTLGGGAQVAGGVLVGAVPALLALIGTILLFTPGANRFFARR